MSFEDYFNNAKDKLKELMEQDIDLMSLVKTIELADTERLPRNKYPAIILEADEESIEVATSKRVRIIATLNVWIYIPISLGNIKEENAERSLLKIGACLNKFFSFHEKEEGYWIQSNWEGIDYGYKQTDKLLRAGLMRWSGEMRIQGGWTNG